jgi:hypothetical protein
LQVGTGGSVGAAPVVALGWNAYVGVRRSWFSAALEGRVQLPVEGDVPGGGRVEISQLSGALVPCGHLGVGLACLRASVGRLRGTSSGILNARSDATAFTAMGLRAGLDLPIQGPLSLRLYGDIDLRLTRTEVLIAAQDAWSTPPFSATLGFAGQIEIP